MTDKNASKDKNDDVSNQHQREINLRLKQMDNSIQPIYSNVVTVSGNRGIVMLDFGYIDIQIVASLDKMFESGENFPKIIDARVTCRVALSSDRVSQLIKDLNNIIQPQQVAKSVETQVEQTASVPKKDFESSVEVVKQSDHDLTKPLRKYGKKKVDGASVDNDLPRSPIKPKKTSH